jgi:SAM-dependent methyltransferase/tetratricopeptide (TPR) repeat protein
MNRKERRAGLKRGISSAPIAPSSDWDKAFTTADLMAKANGHHQQRQLETARDICNRIVAREASHVPALNLLGLIFQDAGRHKRAVKEFTKAIAADDLDAACHYNLATSYQALNRRDEAEAHFKKAITLGMSRKNIADFIRQNPTIIACIKHLDEKQFPRARSGELLGKHDLESIANDVFLQCALEMILVPTAPLERFLTFLRSVLLDLAYSSGRLTAIDDRLVRLFCALAQQCFINEYIFTQNEEETRHSTELRNLVLQKSASGEEISPLLLAAVGAYFPLHSLPVAHALSSRNWPEIMTGLVRQQIREPLEETDDVSSIPLLTAVENSLSLQVMRQYGENPYPRWTINPLAAFAADWRSPIVSAGDHKTNAIKDILIAGCGTGQHVFPVVHNFPEARVLAVDISLPSLAYARRKAREARLRNVEFAQADILGLGAIGRSFDLIEAVGVLHHLAEPETGWRVLLSLLRPNGEMRVGLYSEAARSAVVAVREFIAEHGYRPTVEDIRKCRQAILRDAEQRRWKSLIEARDFYSTSGCRDYLFNVMEHRFTIPRIKDFLKEQRLVFLGFDLEPRVLEKFQNRFPGTAALTDLDHWDAFEADNPQTFRQMYQFMLRRE